MDTGTYGKHVGEVEYENHKLFLKGGIMAPSIVTYYESDGTLETVFITGKVISDSDYSRDQAVSICLKLITEVEKLHTLGYLHGNLSPTNVLVGDDGNVYLLDFNMSSEIMNASIEIEEEMMGLLRLLILVMSSEMITVYNLMMLCRKTMSSRMPLELKCFVTYDTLRETVLLRK